LEIKKLKEGELPIIVENTKDLVDSDEELEEIEDKYQKELNAEFKGEKYSKNKNDDDEENEEDDEEVKESEEEENNNSKNKNKKRKFKEDEEEEEDEIKENEAPVYIDDEEELLKVKKINAKKI
jgi:hypothetical protein